jgi:hypothetical protein
MKGIVEFVLVAAIAFLLVWATYWHLMIGKTVEFQLMTNERDVLSTINKMEQIKIGLPYALRYSFEKAFYDLGQKGGYNAIPSNIPTKDGLPYWRYGNEFYIPKWYEETAKATKIYLNEYIEKATGNSIYKEVKVDRSSVNATSDELLVLKGSNCKVETNLNVSIFLDMNRFKVYEVAEEYVKNHCSEVFYCDTTDPDRVCAWYYQDKEEVLVIDERYKIIIWNVTENSYELVKPVLKFKIKC